MNILIIAAGYPPDIKGGGEVSTKIIAEQLAERGNKVNVLTVSEIEKVEVINHVTIYRHLSPNIFWNFNAQPSILKKITWHLLDNYNPRTIKLVSNYINKLQPDVVLTSTLENFGADAWNACNDLNVPVVHVLRSYYTICYRGTCFKSGKNCDAPCAECNALTIGRRRAAKKVNGLIGISNFILDKHSEYFPHAIKERIFNPIEVKDSTSKKLTGDSITFGFLGRLEAEKGIELLLKTFSTLPKEFVLKVGGSGNESYEKYLKETYNQPNIEFMGWTNPQNLYENIDFLILPAMWHEPFGRVVIEAFSYGLPVIGSKRGGITELIEEGRSGYLFEPSDEGDLKEVLINTKKMISRYCEMSQYASSQSKLFSKEYIGEAYEYFLFGLIEK